MALKLSVKTFREAGLQAKWCKVNRGTPAVMVRNPNAKLAHQRDKWWVITKTMWASMEKNGVVEGFEQCTLLGDIFSIPA